MLIYRVPLLVYLVTSTSSAFPTVSKALLSSTSSGFLFSEARRTQADLSSTSRSMSSIPDDAAAGLTDIGSKNGVKSVSSNNETTWREKIAISAAKSRKVRGGNYVQLATVDPTTNEPRCRTVVFRGFLPIPQEDTNAQHGICSGQSCVMKMITDLRSSKVSEASSNKGNNNNDVAELVWWFGKSSEQYRIRGKLVFVGGGHFETDHDEFLARARKEQWGNLSDVAREQFYWKDPGVPYEDQNAVPPGARDEQGKLLPPPDSFLLVLLYPKYVDYLLLGENYRQVDQFKDGEWSFSRVNP
mmetsp:Transcript_27646/g.50188  ORF Transcript_27646/g.50188 Transcript_27646/m.50188 type:complete len:300 (-) Transcript_27646:8-907(-)